MILKLAKWFVAGVMLLLLALVVYLDRGDLNWLKPRIESVVAANSEFRLALEGELALDLFPDTAILVEGVTFSHADTENGGLDIGLGHLSARLRLASLLARPLLIEELTVRDLSVHVIPGPESANEHVNSDTASDGLAGGIPVIVRSARLDNISFRGDRSDGRALRAELSSVTIDHDSKDQFELYVSGAVGEPAPIPLRANLRAQISPDEIQLRDIQLRIGESDVSGSVSVSTGARPAVTGKLSSERLHLGALADSIGESADKTTTDPDKTEPRDLGHVFGSERLAFEPLQGLDIDLTLFNKELIVGRWNLVDVTTKLQLTSGALLLTNAYLGPNGGRSASRLGIDVSREPAIVHADVRSRDLRLNLISGDIDDISQIPPVDITIDVTATGNSPRSLAASANGRVLISLRQGKVSHSMVGLLAGDFMSQLFGMLNPFAKDEDDSALECTIVGAEINNGTLDFSRLLLQTAKIKALGDGGIDLGTETVGIEFETQAREGLGVSASMLLTPFVRLEGTLVQPEIKVDKKGALLAGATTVATGGLNLLAKGASDRKSGQEGECMTLIRELGGHAEIE